MKIVYFLIFMINLAYADEFVFDNPPLTSSIKEMERRLGGKLSIVDTYEAESETPIKKDESSSSCIYSGYCHGHGFSMGKYSSGYAYRSNCQGRKTTTRFQIPSFKVIHLDLIQNKRTTKKLIARSKSPISYETKEETSSCK